MAFLNYDVAQANGAVQSLLQYVHEHREQTRTDKATHRRVIPSIHTEEGVGHAKDIGGDVATRGNIEDRIREMRDRFEKGRYPTREEMEGLRTHKPLWSENLPTEEEPKKEKKSAHGSPMSRMADAASDPDRAYLFSEEKYLADLIVRSRELMTLLNGYGSKLGEVVPMAAAVEEDLLTNLQGTASAHTILERAASSEFSAHDKSKNKLEIIEGEDGKKKLVIRKSLRNLVYKKMQQALEGIFRPGDEVAIDVGHYIDGGTVTAYLGNGMYRVALQATGAEVEVGEKNIFKADSGPRR